MPATSKIVWGGRITSVQPRIRLTRSFDQRSHEYLGYVLTVEGRIESEPAPRVFLVAIGDAANAKHQFQVGDEVSGESEPVADQRTETAELYKTAKLQIHSRVPKEAESPPWLGVPPPLETYRARGHRRLAAKTYETKCTSCIWGARMAVEMIIDQWDQSKKRYRVETFCYGPKSCRFYKAGPPRKVPGRKGMSWTEEDWVDDDATAHRGPDD